MFSWLFGPAKKRDTSREVEPDNPDKRYFLNKKLSDAKGYVACQSPEELLNLYQVLPEHEFYFVNEFMTEQQRKDFAEAKRKEYYPTPKERMEIWAKQGNQDTSKSDYDRHSWEPPGRYRDEYGSKY